MNAPVPVQILVVDDHDSARYARARILRRAGYDVLEASNGRAALEMIGTHRPALVVLDIHLPDINGLEVCREIKGNPRTAVIPVLHMSATNISAPDQVRGLEGGADGYLVEPVAPDVLVATVGALLRMRRAEEEARQSRRSLDALVSNLPGAAYRADRLGGRLILVSERALELTGHASRDLLARPNGWWDLIDPEDAPAVAALAAAATQSQAPAELVYRLRVPDGSIRWIWDRATPVHSEGDRGTTWEGFATDITERKRAQQILAEEHDRLERLVSARTDELRRSHEQLRISERMAALGTLSAGLGHDMGNLLLPVRVRLNAMEQEGRFSEDVRAIQTCVSYLERLVSGLRLLVIDPRGRPSTETTDIPAWWPTAEVLLQSLLGSNVSLRHHFDPDLPVVAAAPPAVTQAVFNLVQNALDAISNTEGGEITVWAKAEQNGQWVRIGVTDNGPGMTDEVRRHCQEPFFSTKPRQFATGLGLSLVHRIAETVGGRLEIESSPGAGSTFALVVPARRSDHEPATAAAGSIAVVSLPDERLRGYLAMVLSGAGLAVRDADDLEGAMLWLTEPQKASAAMSFLAKDTRRRVIFFGDGGPQHERAMTVSPDAGVAAVRDVILVNARLLAMR